MNTKVQNVNYLDNPGINNKPESIIVRPSKLIALEVVYHISPAIESPNTLYNSMCRVQMNIYVPILEIQTRPDILLRKFTMS